MNHCKVCNLLYLLRHWTHVELIGYRMQRFHRVKVTRNGITKIRNEAHRDEARSQLKVWPIWGGGNCSVPSSLSTWSLGNSSEFILPIWVSIQLLASEPHLLRWGKCLRRFERSSFRSLLVSRRTNKVLLQPSSSDSFTLMSPFHRHLLPKSTFEFKKKKHGHTHGIIHLVHLGPRKLI